MTVFGIAGWKNSGKTGVMERLVAELTRRGYRVSTIKHAHHDFDVDQPGKDSHRHRVAGAQEVLLSSGRRWALMHELRDAPEPTLDDLIGKLDPVDIVLVEGFKTEPHPKLECHRVETGKGLLAEQDASIVAVASNAEPAVAVPVLDLNDTTAIADLVVSHTGLGA